MLTNMTCNCVAYTAFDNYTGKCLGICGDGVAFANDCDLGSLYNGMPGYGCDSTCHVVSGWYCSAPSNTSASICVIKTVYSGQYLYATKEASSNTANLYIQLPPNDPYLTQMNFDKLIKTSIPTSALNATYDPSTGILLIKATYTQSI